MNVNKVKHLAQLIIDLQSTERKFYLVFTTVAFAFLFVIVFEPFGIHTDGSKNADDIFVEISIAMVVAFATLLISQFALRDLFRIKAFTIFSSILWFVFESVLVAAAWTLLDVIQNNSTENLFEHGVNNLLLFILITFIPYSLYISYIVITDRFKQLKTDKLANPNQSQQNRTFSIPDENAKTQLLVNEYNLLYIQSADNYLEVLYLKDNAVDKTLIRNSIKAVEGIFEGSSVLRCHRSFIVNTAQIELAKKEGSGYLLHLKHVTDRPIPVSKSYQSEIRKVLANQP